MPTNWAVWSARFRWAGDNDIGLDFEGAEHAPHHHALFFAFGDKPALRVELCALAGDSSIGMAHEVEIHGRGAGVSGRAEPLPLNLDFNMFVTFLSRLRILTVVSGGGSKMLEKCAAIVRANWIHDRKAESLIAAGMTAPVCDTLNQKPL